VSRASAHDETTSHAREASAGERVRRDQIRRMVVSARTSLGGGSSWAGSSPRDDEGARRGATGAGDDNATSPCTNAALESEPADGIASRLFSQPEQSSPQGGSFSVEGAASFPAQCELPAWLFVSKALFIEADAEQTAAHGRDAPSSAVATKIDAIAWRTRWVGRARVVLVGAWLVMVREFLITTSEGYERT
jgi:hypothetical protein